MILLISGKLLKQTATYKDISAIPISNVFKHFSVKLKHCQGFPVQTM